MRDTSARDSYLHEVAARLRLPDGVRDEVIEELATHLADATDEGVAQGLSFDAAERGALDRLGPADALADRLRRAHQTTRQLLAAVGGGLWAAGRDGLRGYLAALLVLLFAGMALSSIGPLLSGLLRMPISIGAFQDATAWAAVIATTGWVAAWWAAHGAVTAMARGTGRHAIDVWGPVAVVGGGLVAAAAALVPMAHSWWSVAIVACSPFVFVLSAFRAGRRATPIGDSGARSSRGLAGLGAVLIGMMLVYVVVTTATGSLVVSAPPDPGPAVPTDTRGLDRISDRQVAAGYPMLDIAPWYPSTGPVTVSVDMTPGVTRSGLQLEVWRATVKTDGVGTWDATIDARHPEPIVTIPVTGEAGQVRLDLHRHRTVGHYFVALVAVDAVNGQRVLIGEPGSGEAAFHGSIIDWLIAPD